MLAAVLALSVAVSADEISLRTAFARWRQLATETKSLAVEFTLTRRDSFRGREQVCDCTLRLLRTDSDVLAKLVTHDRATKDVFECVLKGGGYHLPNPAEKRLLVYKPETVLPTAAGFFSPLLAALWADKPAESFALRVSLRERFYTHLDYTPKASGAKLDAKRGRVVIVHRANDQLPVGVPRQLWYDVPGGDTRVTLDIQKWEMNGQNPPKVRDFDLPGEKDGWKVGVTEGFWKNLEKRRNEKR